MRNVNCECLKNYKMEEQEYSGVAEMIKNVIKKALKHQGKEIKIPRVVIYTESKDCAPKYMVLNDWSVHKKDISFDDLIGVKVDFTGRSTIAALYLPDSFKTMCKENDINYENIKIIMQEGECEPLAMLYDGTTFVKYITFERDILQVAA